MSAQEFGLLGFQGRAARQIADRYELLKNDPQRPAMTRAWDVPFFQALSAITGAGKTAILAQTVAEMATGMQPQPVVLWVSRLRAVVEQTVAALLPSGRYGPLLAGWSIQMLGQASRDEIVDGSGALLLAATVGSFTRDAPEGSDLSVHRVRPDDGTTSLWDVLKARSENGVRRPLFIVYDEAQNLTDAQTDLLLGLEPDAVLVASATMKIRERLDLVLGRLKREGGWSDRPIDDELNQPSKCLITRISNVAVVDEELIKKEVALGGYDSAMEGMLDDLLDEMRVSHRAAELAGLPFRARCIHVCQTNINGDDGTKETANKPFLQRRAPPILIWRHLVARGVDPSQIAVYCDLATDRASHPLPDEFVLFAGGDRDFAAFSAGNFTHIIFNQALQEGWDDPQVAFAYIDKTMGSNTQVEQVIGRVLRQPGVTHYADAILNRATFYIRLDDRQQFQNILDDVRQRLGSEPGGVQIKIGDYRSRQRSREETQKNLTVPHPVPLSDVAAEAMDETLARMADYRAGGANVRGQGIREAALLEVGSDAAAEISVTVVEHSSMVTARWVMSREMRALYPKALAAIEVDDLRLDALVERTSAAADNFRQLGQRLVDIYLSETVLHVEPTNPYRVMAIDVDPNKAVSFNNAAHKSYSLNPLELPIARAIDGTGHDWCRNPENGGWSIPLLSTGPGRRFFPDFLVWKGRDIFAIDPKGPHILAGDAGRKVMSLTNPNRGTRVFTRLISEGRWNDSLSQVSDGGYTVWSWDMSTGRLRQRHFATAPLAISSALRP